MFQTLKYYKLWFIMSGAILIFGVGSLSLFGLNLGIDFTGGSLMELKFKAPFEHENVRKVLDQKKLEGYSLQSSENFGLIIKTKPLEKAEYDSIITELKSQAGDLEEGQFESIGPVIGGELKLKAIYQLIFVSVGILVYIGYAFRKVAKPVSPVKFGIAAIIALFHDLLFLLGVFSLLGRFKGVEIDSMFVTAVLTVLGFSVHDTIVVFDRIRENLKIFGGQSIEFIINHSIAQTIVRSLNTSLTVLFVLLALLLFGGATIKYFILALFIGIIVGTYSSIFIASPVLFLMQKKRG
ncbi:MAG: protein translocase subunit SecF [Patescibacteria group bacterium]